MKSLDPRVNRLPQIPLDPQVASHPLLDQFGTFEVFVAPKAGKPFQHEGAVHAPNLELAFVLAKETFTRRFSCASLCVVETRNIAVSAMTEGKECAYDLLPEPAPHEGELNLFEIYHLKKRGKQHVHAGQVTAASPLHAMSVAKQELREGEVICNVWAIPALAIRYTAPEEADLWLTLPEKKFRDATDYRGGDTLSEFLNRRPLP